MIKILIREYGDKVKIVGISDASGCAEDEDGLDHNEVSVSFIQDENLEMSRY